MCLERQMAQLSGWELLVWGKPLVLRFSFAVEDTRVRDVPDLPD